MISIRWAEAERDLEFLQQWDRHLPPEKLDQKTKVQEILLLFDTDAPVGWLRFGYFWDTVPVMNMLVLLESHRGQGLGRKLVEYWETAMARQGYKQVMTSTQADEQAQFFYRRLGYQDCGGFLVPGQVPLEIILWKTLET